MNPKKADGPVISADIPIKFQPLFRPAPYKISYSGRGGLKSWSFARALLLLGAQKKLKILCAREYQNSIKESVYTLLREQVSLLGLESFYQLMSAEIRGLNGTTIIFKGLRNNPQEIKSTEGVDIAWVEEAQNTSDESWEILIPTVRKAGSEIWISFNPKQESDPTWRRFIILPPPGAVIIKSNWRDNPWMSDKSMADKDHLQKTDPDSYEYVWEGGFEVARQGAYYHALIMDAERDGRITAVPYDPAVPVDTSWDIGVDDETDIWFWQAIPGGEYHLVDHIHASDQGIDYFLGELAARKYRYGKDYVPHDFKARSFAGGGRSSWQIAKNHGRNLILVPAMNPIDRIQPVRTILPRCWFDKSKCAHGLQSLRNYKRQWDNNRQTFLNHPEHDWASHGADSFGHFAVMHKKKSFIPADEETMVAPIPGNNQNTWMSI